MNEANEFSKIWNMKMLKLFWFNKNCDKNNLNEIATKKKKQLFLNICLTLTQALASIKEIKALMVLKTYIKLYVHISQFSKFQMDCTWKV